MLATDPLLARAAPLHPPGPPPVPIARPRVAARLSGPERVVLVVAPPGSGKTEAVRQWSETARGIVDWVPVDLLDGPPGDLDDVVAAVERDGRRSALVVDDAWRPADRSVIGRLAPLVSRVGHLVRFVIIDRTDPPLPLGRWRSRGWLAEIRADDLRVTDAEAVQAARAVTGSALSDAEAVALNARAEGWAIGLHLALAAVAREPGRDRRARAVAESDRLLRDHLVSEVLDPLSPDLRDVLLALSVLRGVDRGLGTELLGQDALPAVDELCRRGLLLTPAGTTGEAVRLPHLVRALLEDELRWRDPGRHRWLHRRAAELWRARGDLVSAHRHLFAIDDLPGATALAAPAAGGPGVRAAGAAGSELAQALTPRELTLLVLLPTHLSYAEIGERLYLSVNTIKSNLKAVYRKLEVTSRTDAVETARRLGLLEVGPG